MKELRIIVKTIYILLVSLMLFHLEAYATSTIKLTEINIHTVLISENTNYVVSTSINLKGSSIKIPKGSNLSFTNRGYFKNGTIYGNSSEILAPNNQTLFENVCIQGIWNCPQIYSSWMKFTEDGHNNRQCFQNLCNLSSDECESVITISQGHYNVSADANTHVVINVNSHTKIHIDGTIQLLPNDFSSYSIINIANKQNVVLDGGGEIVGDVKYHKGSKGEWGMGIQIKSSRYVEIKNISISDCWGDCIYIGQQLDTNKDGYSSDITIKNVKCANGRRQGLSIITGKNIIIERCKFFNTGAIKSTPPSSGIDIEPNTDFGVLDNIQIISCEFAGNNIGWDLLLTRMNLQSRVYVKDCAFPKGVRLAKQALGAEFIECFIRAIEDKYDNAQKMEWIDCTILDTK